MNGSAATNSKDKPLPLASGVPPWHSIALVVVLLAFSLLAMPSDLDRLAKVETFTHRVFPELVSLQALVIIRLVIAISCWMVTIYMVFISEGWDIDTHYKPPTRLRQAVLRMHGWNTLCPFTSWCWIMLGTSFSLNAYFAHMANTNREDEVAQWVLRVALILWEVAAPFTLMVSAVVRYAIWPAVLATGKRHGLGSFRNQMQHNMNSIYALSEMALLGGLPIQFSHMALPFLVGIVYILFTWCMCYKYAKPEFGPQYLYWFMDTTLEKTTTIALAALLMALVASFAAFGAIESFVEWAGPSLFTHALCVIVVSSLVVKTG